MREKKMKKSLCALQNFAAATTIVLFMATMGLVTAGGESETCQCGVFLLAQPPLIYSADAKPVLSGLPVAANCSAREDKISCATICRQLIQAMSESHENSPLVQTVVHAATRTLACQRFNESHKVPLPRTISASPHHTLATLDETRRIWKFSMNGGPLARSDVQGEIGYGNQHKANGPIDNNEEDENSLREKLTEPKWLGGFYRWCDEHWVYAGVSLEEPLCCLKHLPKKCPSGKKETESTSSDKINRNGRRPRLIIKRRPEEDTSSEEQDLQLVGPTSGENSSSKPTPTTSTGTDSVESETTDGIENNTSSETLNPFETTARPLKPKKPLNSTVVAEAFRFVGSLLETLGYEQFVHGFASVLPTNTASELLERVDVGGWVSNYQDRYMTWPREFSMGYCYLEYSVYNLASEGILATTSNLLSRVFKSSPSPMGQNPNGNPNKSNFPFSTAPSQPQDAPPTSFNSVLQNSVPNYIQSMPESAFGNYGHPGGIPGNRRVRRDVTVSRSYSAVGSQSQSGPRRTTPRKAGRGRNAPVPSDTYIQNHATLVPTTEAPKVHVAPVPPPVQLPTSQPGVNSFNAHNQNAHSQYNANPFSPEYYQHQYSNDAMYRSSHNGGVAKKENLSEFARPRRHNAAVTQAETPGNGRRTKQQQVPKRRDSSTGKDSGGAGNLMNIANLLLSTAMAGNGGGGGGGGGGDAVSAIIQNALPLVSQVATSPMIQKTVSSLVQGFLTPPRPHPHNDHNEDNQNNRPSSTKNPPKAPAHADHSNEIDEEVSSSNHRPQESGLPPLFGGGGGGGGGALTSMLGQIMETYVKHLFSSPEPPHRPGNSGSSSNTKKPVPSRNDEVTKPGENSSSGSSSSSGSGSDIVDMISEVAKPFFISYFGVVPGEPGYGRLKISERRDIRLNKDSSGYSTEILTNDPDAGTGILDILSGAVNIPETGNFMYDFGNRVVYAFGRANDPQQGMYCLKQYSVNKLWDYFRVGVRTLFKK